VDVVDVVWRWRLIGGGPAALALGVRWGSWGARLSRLLLRLLLLRSAMMMLPI